MKSVKKILLVGSLTAVPVLKTTEKCYGLHFDFANSIRCYFATTLEHMFELEALFSAVCGRKSGMKNLKNAVLA